MLRYGLSSRDLSAVRFGISPLAETGLALRALKAPEAFPLQQPWLDRIRHLLPLLDTEVLLALVDDRRWVVDFATPRPMRAETTFEEDLDTLRALPQERIRADLHRLHGTVPLPFVGEPDAVTVRLAKALQEFWRLCMAPHWPRMRTILRADIAYRSRQMAQAGLVAVLNGLAPAVRYEDPHLDIQLRSRHLRNRPVDGQGLTLVPSFFVVRASGPTQDDQLPSIAYPVRGQGAMWSVPTVEPGAVRDLLGQTRSTILQVLGEPASSTELAQRLGVTPSAANQHLRVLHRAGLLGRTQYGRSVLYQRSALADALVAPT